MEFPLFSNYRTLLMAFWYFWLFAQTNVALKGKRYQYTNTIIKVTTEYPKRIPEDYHHHHHHHHHVQEALGLIPVPCILKMKLVPPSLPRSSYVSSSFWFIL